ncbi:hypothetical protein FA15DRAFT_222323 [Coprinopsis marcescibilis]|uniref:Uncharacterized protein n=1 Tax=Coprinopsis marcescibilis TaxID=230819 RepID=A0A5C3KGB4_COPMA|nr:hypothetical protein FA15DRAFT_222323 [Coprinopsis marcescibilis]
MLSLPYPFVKFDVVYADPLLEPGAKGVRIAYSRRQSVAEMEEIFQVEPGQLVSMFSDLHSLYSVKWDQGNDVAVKPHHKSVRDFLLDPTRCGELVYSPIQTRFYYILLLCPDSR